MFEYAILTAVCAVLSGFILISVYNNYMGFQRLKFRKQMSGLVYTASGGYRGVTRSWAKLLKRGDKYAVKQTARALQHYIPRRAVVIPVPSCTGHATYMLQVAEQIKKLRPDITVADICKGSARESWCERKKKGTVLPTKWTFNFRLTAQPHPNDTVVFIDNVKDTGATLTAATSLVKGSTGVVLAHVENRYE